MGQKTDLTQYLKDAQTLNEGLDILGQLLPCLGMTCYMFTQISTQDSPSTFKVNLYETNYPDEWIKTYVEKQYFYIDPVAKKILCNDKPFYWSEYLPNVELDEDAQAMMTEAMSYNLNDGIGCSYLKNKGQLYTFSLATDKVFNQYDTEFLGEIYLIGAYLVDIHQKQFQHQGDFESLSPREQEVISMAAMGKTDAEIATIAGISTNTVRYHWKNIFNKMDSYSRVFAIIRALNLGYVNTQRFELPTSSGSGETYQKSV